MGAARLHVRGRALHGADAAQHPPQALRQGPPADLGGLRQSGHLHHGRRDGHRRHRLQLRAGVLPQGPDRRLQGGRRRLHRPHRAVQERQRHDHQRGDLHLRPQAGPRDRAAPVPRLPVLDGRASTTTPFRSPTTPRPGPRRSPASATRRTSTGSSKAAGCCVASPTRSPSSSPGTRRWAPTSSSSASPRTRWSTRRSSRCSRSSAPRSSPSSTRTRSTRPPATGRPPSRSTRRSRSPYRTSSVPALPTNALIQLDGTRQF